MSPFHSLARSFIAPTFLSTGIEAVRNPETKIAAVERMLPRLHRMGITQTPEQLVRMNGSVQVAAGLLLLIGRLPRLASAALAMTLVPTTVAVPRFWKEKDMEVKSAQKREFFGNLSLLGGLLLAAFDRNGSPSLTWRAKQGAGTLATSIQSAGLSLMSHGSHDSLAERTATLGEAIREVAAPILTRGLEVAESVGASVVERASHVGDSVHAHTGSLLRSL